MMMLNRVICIASVTTVQSVKLNLASKSGASTAQAEYKLFEKDDKTSKLQTAAKKGLKTMGQYVNARTFHVEEFSAALLVHFCLTKKI